MTDLLVPACYSGKLERGELSNQFNWHVCRCVRRHQTSSSTHCLTLPMLLSSCGSVCTDSILKNLKVLQVTGSGLTGQLPAEYADPLAMQRVRAVAVAAAQATAAKATVDVTVAEATVTQLLSGESGPAKRFSTSRQNNASANPLLLQALKKYTDARQRLSAANRVYTAVADAVASISSSGVAALGLMQLQKLLLSDNQLSGQLPAKYANLEQLQVGCWRQSPTMRRREEIDGRAQ